MSTPDPPMPRDFGLRYMIWIAWTNKLTILMALQALFTAVTLDPTLVNHQVAHWCLIVANVLGIVGAQYSRRNPIPPPPVQGQPISTIIKPPKE